MSRPELTVDIAFAAGPLGAAPVWTDVSADVLRIESIRRGRTTELGKFEAGTASIVLDNSEGTYTPGNTASPYYALLRPIKRIRINAEWDAVSYHLFDGYIERWPAVFSGGFETTVTLPCVDAFGAIFQQAKLTYSRGAEDSHWRLQAVLDAIGWPAGRRTILSTGATGGKTTIAAVSLTHSAPLTHMQDVVLAEDGAGFIGPDGNYVFQGRHTRYLTARSTTVQATFGDDPNSVDGWVLGTSVLGVDTIPRPFGWDPGDLSELPYLSADPVLDVQYVVNDAQVRANGGPIQQATDGVSLVEYSTRTRALNLLLTSDTEALDRATWEVLRNNQPDIRFPALPTSGFMDDGLWPSLLTLDISDRVAVVKRPPNSATLRRECWIEAIEHRNITDQSWETVYNLSPVLDPAVLGGGPWILEDDTAGMIDSIYYIGY
jgi:hypothetical protein